MKCIKINNIEIKSVPDHNIRSNFIRYHLTVKIGMGIKYLFLYMKQSLIGGLSEVL